MIKVRFSSAPIGPIWTKKIWAQRARGVLSNDQGSVLLVPFKPLLLGSYWFDQDEKNMGRARRALSNDRGLVLLDAIVPEKKIVKEIFFFPLFPLNRYNSAPIGPICMQKIWRDEPFKRPRSGSPRCYSFGEKNS
ncbi:LOW QUALITY PROTEIN: hypothetical protein V1477_006335 [Vespula maculifrons]|uniref:Uncharacterized protein n=1 Tax=Vespula maculifrons TaxID=7453 RepID=A0ABD2CL65_VESMC